MNPSILFVITSDPQTSHRPAEAMRIAAGIGTWRQCAVAVYLRGLAAALLGATQKPMVDEEICRQNLAMLVEAGGAVYVQRETLPLPSTLHALPRLQAISDSELLQLADQYTLVLHF